VPSINVVHSPGPPLLPVEVELDVVPAPAPPVPSTTTLPEQPAKSATNAAPHATRGPIMRPPQKKAIIR
jgi:hypothetical protein